MSSTDVEPRAAIDWYWRPTNQVRAILEALAEAGILAHRPARGQPPRLRPDRAAVPRRAARAPPDRGRAASPHAAVAVPGQRPARAQRGLHAVDRRLGKARRVAVRDAATSSSSAATSSPWPSTGSAARGTSSREELPLLDQAEAEVERRASSMAGGSGGRRGPGVAFLAPLDPLAWDRDQLRGCGTSTTAGRSTSRPRSGAGATTCCRSCTATGSSDGSSPGRPVDGHAPDPRPVVGGGLRPARRGEPGLRGRVHGRYLCAHGLRRRAQARDAEDRGTRAVLTGRPGCAGRSGRAGRLLIPRAQRG